MKIAVIGDLFVRSKLFQESLKQNLTSIVGEITFLCRDLEWPEAPVVSNEEISEFVGDPREIAEWISEAQIIVTHVAPITRDVIEATPNLQIIGCCRGGPVNINIEAATENGIPVVNAAGRNSQAVVEFTLGLILTECRGISRAHCALANGVWQGDFYRYDKAGRELKGQVIGLVGFGIIAQMLVAHLNPFKMRILAYDPYTPAEQFDALGVERADLKTLLKASDIVSLHARVTPETKGIIGKNEFSQMKPGTYFINTARGPLVDYDALYIALKNGHLAGAALDTFSIEPPPPDWPLLRLKNVTLTPHIAGSSRESAFRGVEIVVRDITNFFSDEPLEHCVNPAMRKSS
jgi:D-3-phosphoglycerate dehydrogenase